MPRPKPSEPWVNIALRLTPAQADKIRTWASKRGVTVSDAFRDIVDDLDSRTGQERFADYMGKLKAQQDVGLTAARALDGVDVPIRRPKAKPGSLLKKR